MASEILQKASEAAAAMPEARAFKDDALRAFDSRWCVKLEEVHSTMCCPTCGTPARSHIEKNWWAEQLPVKKNWLLGESYPF